jgi:hypothetical protein
VAAADNFPYHFDVPQGPPDSESEVYVPFHLTAADFKAGLPPLGHLRPDVFSALQVYSAEESDPSATMPFTILGSRVETQAVCFSQSTVDQGKMGEILNDIVVRWKKEGKFPGPLGGELAYKRC